MEAGKVHYKPLYLQVKDVIIKRIENEAYKNGETIPPESSLAEEFGTSITTIRQALTLLVDDGILVKKQGRGTIVSRQNTKLTFFSWLPETPQGAQILQNALTLFHEKHPSITVECVPSQYNQARKTLMKLISSGNAPDVAHIQSHWTSYFASVGALEPLEPLVEKSNLDNRFYEKDLAGGIYRNKLYSLAWGLCPVALIANKHLLKAAGIADIPSPMTLETLQEVCQQIDRVYEGEDKYCYALNSSVDQESDFLTLYFFLLAFDGTIINEQGEVVLNSPENIEAFTWLRNFVNSVRVFKSSVHDIRKRFARGDIAFMSDAPWIKYQLEEHTGQPFDDNFMALLNPVLSSQAKSRSWTYNHALSICAQSEYKPQAAKLIDALTNDYEISNLYYSQVGHLPNNRNYLADPLFEPPFFATFKQQLTHSSCIHAENAFFSKAMTFCTDAVKKILYEQADIEQELDEKEYYLNMLYSD